MLRSLDVLSAASIWGRWMFQQRYTISALVWAWDNAVHTIGLYPYVQIITDTGRNRYTVLGPKLGKRYLVPKKVF